MNSKKFLLTEKKEEWQKIYYFETCSGHHDDEKRGKLKTASNVQQSLLKIRERLSEQKMAQNGGWHDRRSNEPKSNDFLSQSIFNTKNFCLSMNKRLLLVVETLTIATTNFKLEVPLENYMIGCFRLCLANRIFHTC